MTFTRRFIHLAALSALSIAAIPALAQGTANWPE